MLVAPWDIEDEGFVVVDCWSALAPLVTLCEPLPMFTPGLTSAPMLAFELLTPTFASTPTLGFTLRLRVPDVVLSVPPEEVPEALGLEDDVLLELDGLLEAPLRLMDELLLEGVCVAPLRWMSALDELEDGGVDEEAPAPFRLMSAELDELVPGVLPEIDPFTPEWISVVEDELVPGTTATPGATSVVVTLLPPCASGTLGMQPAGCVLAVSMHFG